MAKLKFRKNQPQDKNNLKPKPTNMKSKGNSKFGGKLNTSPAPKSEEKLTVASVLKTPNSNNKAQKGPTPAKMQKLGKFEGTGAMNKTPSKTPQGKTATPDTEDVKMNRRQLKRLKSKLRKNKLKEQYNNRKNLILEGDLSEITTVTQEIKTLLNSPLQSANSSKRLKDLKKLVSLTKIKKEAPAGEVSKKNNAKKQKKRKNKREAANKTSPQKPVKSESEDSDYDVEKSIKVEKVIKREDNSSSDQDEMDTSGVKVEDSDDDDNDDDDDSDSENLVINDDADKDDSNDEDDSKDEEDSKDEDESDNANGEEAEEDSPEEASEPPKTPKGSSRYVVFVGNLPFEIEKGAIIDHFKKVCVVKDVRIQTDKNSKKSKGFGYVEVKDEANHQKALTLNHTFLNGRRINVLYTEGGKKNSPNKKKELKSKNLKLKAIRERGIIPGGGPKQSQKRSVRRAKKRSFDQKN